MPAPTMEAPAPAPDIEGAEPQLIEGEQLSLDPQITEIEAAQAETVRANLKSEVNEQPHRGFADAWKNLSSDNFATYDQLARERYPKLHSRNPDKARNRFMRHIQSEVDADNKAAWQAERKAGKQAAKAEKAEAKRATLEDLEPKERFSRLKKGYESLKAVYQERRAKRAESQNGEAQVAPEETSDSRLEELITKGMDEQTANTVVDVASRIEAYNDNIYKTERQRKRYALDVTRRAVLGQFNVAKLAESQEAMEALIALRKEIGFIQNGEEATEPAELDVLVAEQKDAIVVEIADFQKRDRARKIGVAAMAALIGGTGMGVVAADTLGSSSPAAAIEMADTADQADSNTFTTSEGTFRVGMDTLAPPADSVLDTTVDQAASPLKAAVAEANDTAPGAVSSAGEQIASVAAEQQLAGEHTVERGDNLWNIIKGRLGAEASNADIAAEVQRVAELNELSDPDLINPGQSIKF